MPTSPQATSTDAYCPHCMLVVAESVEGPWPPMPSRCPHCRLMIGVGPARDAADGAPGARGAAARVLPPAGQRGGAGGASASADVVPHGGWPAAVLAWPRP